MTCLHRNIVQSGIKSVVDNSWGVGTQKVEVQGLPDIIADMVEDHDSKSLRVTVAIAETVCLQRITYCLVLPQADHHPKQRDREECQHLYWKEPSCTHESRKGRLRFVLVTICQWVKPQPDSENRVVSELINNCETLRWTQREPNKSAQEKI